MPTEPELITSAEAKRNLLEEAIDVVCGDRNNAYGPPSQDFERVAAMASVIWGHKLTEPLESHDVAIFMVLLKLSRLVWSPDRRDSWVDIAGYAACGWQCVLDKAEAQAVLPEPDEDTHCVVGPEHCNACAEEAQDVEQLIAELDRIHSQADAES